MTQEDDRTPGQEDSPRETPIQVTYRTQMAFAIGVANLGVGLLVALVGRMVLPPAWAVGAGLLLQGFGVACFLVLGRQDRDSRDWPRLRRRFAAVCLWLCALWLLLPLAQLPMLAGYLLLCGTTTWALWRIGRN